MGKQIKRDGRQKNNLVRYRDEFGGATHPDLVRISRSELMSLGDDWEPLPEEGKILYGFHWVCTDREIRSTWVRANSYVEGAKCARSLLPELCERFGVGVEKLRGVEQIDELSELRSARAALPF